MKNFLIVLIVVSVLSGVFTSVNAQMIDTDLNWEVDTVEMNVDLTNEIQASAKFLAEKNIIVDWGDNFASYKTDDDITRREMLKIMMNISWKNVSESCNMVFSDMDSDDWGCKYAEAALSNWFIAANEMFRPDDSISQAESLKMVMQARGISRAENSDWRAGYESVALEKWVLEAELDYDESAKRGLIFLSAARTYNEFTESKVDALQEDEAPEDNSVNTEFLPWSENEVSATQTIAEIAVENENLSTLVTALGKANLVDTLSDDSSTLTVFAPTNEAFEMLEEWVLEMFLMEENMQELVNLLTYHVVPWKYMSNELDDELVLETLSWKEINFEYGNSWEIMINWVVWLQIINIPASNGVIHVIDSVLLPSQN